MLQQQRISSTASSGIDRPSSHCRVPARGSTRTRSKASFALLKKDAESEPELVLILDVINDIFTETHSCCFDGPDCMLTWGPTARPEPLPQGHRGQGARVQSQGTEHSQDEL